MRKSSADAAAMLAVAAAALLVGELAIFHRPDLTRTAAFLFDDASYSLFVTREVSSGARLYRDVAYPYGWLPVAIYSSIASVFGNTPTVYLQFFLAISTLGLVLAFALCRRFLSIGQSLAVSLAGLLPVFVVPGSLLGGYASSYYMPVERTLLILAALLWRPPSVRPRSTSVALGAIVSLLQMTRFGPGIVLLAALAGVDALVVRSAQDAALNWRRAASPVIATAALGELLLAVTSFVLLPRPIALDVLWPAYFADVFAGARLWPDLSNWRLVVAQYANPAAGIVLTVAAVWTWTRDRSADDDRWALWLLPLVFVGGMLTFFRTDHHLRQFAWVFVPGAVAALARWRWSWPVALAGWIPVAAVMIGSVVRAPRTDRALLELPRGWQVAATPAERQRIEGIRDALASIGSPPGRGPVMFDPNGAGFYVAYGIPHVSRHTWFYRAAVRPYEVAELEEQYQALTALVVCRFDPAARSPDAILNETFPAALGPAIAARATGIVWSDDRCRVFRLRAAD